MRTFKRRPGNKRSTCYYASAEAYVDLRVPHGFPGEGAPPPDQDEMLILWRATWIKNRVLWRQLVWGDGVQVRSVPPSRPIGWDDGPDRERLEQLTRFTNAITSGSSPDDVLARVGAGPFEVEEARTLLWRLDRSKRGAHDDLDEDDNGD